MNLIVEGCPVANGRGPCCRNCGGGWPGTKVTTEKLTVSVLSGTINPDKLGCQPLQDRARAGLQARQSELPAAVLFEANVLSIEA